MAGFQSRSFLEMTNRESMFVSTIYSADWILLSRVNLHICLIEELYDQRGVESWRQYRGFAPR
jgi:hypothetical protein